MGLVAYGPDGERIKSAKEPEPEAPDNVSCLRVCLFDCNASHGKPPRDVIAKVAPGNATRMAWIPQTIGDQIWVLYEFPAAKERKEWEAGLPGDIACWLDRELIVYAMEFGWGVLEP